MLFSQRRPQVLLVNKQSEPGILLLSIYYLYARSAQSDDKNLRGKEMPLTNISYCFLRRNHDKASRTLSDRSVLLSFMLWYHC